MKSSRQRLDPQIGSIQMCFDAYMADIINGFHRKALELAEQLHANEDKFVIVMMPGKTCCIPIRDNAAYSALDQYELATNPLINPGAACRIQIVLGHSGRLMAVSQDEAYAFIRRVEANRIATEAAIFLQNHRAAQLPETR